MHSELPIPPRALTDPKAFELLRVWVAHKGQHVILLTEVWEDPVLWGMMLVDLAKHIANAYQQSRGDDPADVLTKIRQGFDMEWESATDEPFGHLTS
jgi:hypothetical protein